MVAEVAVFRMLLMQEMVALEVVVEAVEAFLLELEEEMEEMLVMAAAVVEPVLMIQQKTGGQVVIMAVWEEKHLSLMSSLVVVAVVPL